MQFQDMQTKSMLDGSWLQPLCWELDAAGCEDSALTVFRMLLMSRVAHPGTMQQWAFLLHVHKIEVEVENCLMSAEWVCVCTGML